MWTLYKLHVETGDTEPYNCISVMFPGAATGTYSDTGKASLHYRESGIGCNEGGPVDDNVITVTKYDNVDGIVEGTFFTTIIPEIPNGSKVITEGEFR
jgi:hypothetical protein